MSALTHILATLSSAEDIAAWRLLAQLRNDALFSAHAFSSGSLGYAQRLLAEGAWGLAIEVAETVDCDSPHLFEAARVMAAALTNAGESDRALKFARYVFDRAPQDQAAFNRLAGLLKGEDLRAEAEAAEETYQRFTSCDIARLPVWRDDTEDNELYLDLIERVILNTIYQDVSQFNGVAGQYHHEHRLRGADKPALAHTMIGFYRLRQLRRAAECVIREQIPGDFIETGVWRGGACILLRAVLKVKNDKNRIVLVADSFEGLPPPDPRYEKDSYSIIDFHTVPELSVSLSIVKENFSRYGLLDNQVQFLPGFFSETLPSVSGKPLAILRLDGDLYSSTMDALVNLYDDVSEGGFVIIDDYGSVLDARRAVLDFRYERNIESQLYAIDGDGAFWRKGS